MDKPIVSFCIPTYNRCDVLAKTLDSYISSDGFDESIEIVISDNCSTDNTPQICEKYTKKYPNIKYFRNTENIIDKNFPLSLDRGTGHYLKLMNDSLFISKDGVKYLKERIIEHMEDKAPLFFTSGFIFNHKMQDCVKCNSFDDFIKYVSYYVTAIGTFGAWSKDWINVKERTKYSLLKLSQDDWCYQIVASKHNAIVYTRPYYHKYSKAGGKSGYNWFEVHVTNYYKILDTYMQSGHLSKEALMSEKTSYIKELANYISLKYWINPNPDWKFDMSGATKTLWHHFKKIPLFHIMMLTIPIWGNWFVIKYYLKICLLKFCFIKRQYE